MLVIYCSAVVVVFRVCQLYVQQRMAYSEKPPKALLENRPLWMSDFLADEIAKTAQPIGLHSAFDRQLLIDTTNALKASPWIRQVNQVRRAYSREPGDTLLIDCDYRAPVALVRWGEYYWLVDAEGVKLPEQYAADQLPKIIFGSDGKMNVRLVEGVSNPPAEAGVVWPGDDLAAGVELARLLAGRPYAEQIRAINVENYDGRKDETAAQIVLETQFGTQIRWGRPPSAKDSFVEVPASVKLAALANIYTEKKRVDANQAWVDVRFDRVTCPDNTAAQSPSKTADSQDSAASTQ
jgi:hypothetical protein